MPKTTGTPPLRNTITPHPRAVPGTAATHPALVHRQQLMKKVRKP